MSGFTPDRDCVTVRCLDGRRATGHQRPGHDARAIDRCKMQPLGANCVAWLMEPVERVVIRPEAMTEEAVRGLGGSGVFSRGDMMCALIVGDSYRAARRIVCAVRVRQCDGARAQADQQQ
jgi:hypothetical protein